MTPRIGHKTLVFNPCFHIPSGGLYKDPVRHAGYDEVTH